MQRSITTLNSIGGRRWCVASWGSKKFPSIECLTNWVKISVECLKLTKMIFGEFLSTGHVRDRRMSSDRDQSSSNSKPTLTQIWEQVYSKAKLINRLCTQKWEFASNSWRSLFWQVKKRWCSEAPKKKKQWIPGARILCLGWVTVDSWTTHSKSMVYHSKINHKSE
jgi:hypothetical protein